MGTPNFNELFPAGSDLSPRMAYRLWSLSSSFLIESEEDFRKRLPYVASLAMPYQSVFWGALRNRFSFFADYFAGGHPASTASQCVADDVLAHIMLSHVEDGILLGGDEAVEGDSQFGQHHRHQIDDCAETYKTLVYHTEIWRMWELGHEELIGDNWFSAHNVPLWAPARWFVPHHRSK